MPVYYIVEQTRERTRDNSKCPPSCTRPDDDQHRAYQTPHQRLTRSSHFPSLPRLHNTPVSAEEVIGISRVSGPKTSTSTGTSTGTSTVRVLVHQVQCHAETRATRAPDTLKPFSFPAKTPQHTRISRGGHWYQGPKKVHLYSATQKPGRTRHATVHRVQAVRAGGVPYEYQAEIVLWRTTVLYEYHCLHLGLGCLGVRSVLVRGGPKPRVLRPSYA